MNPDFNTFQSLAEVGIAFAGFAALASLIDRAHTPARHNLVKLQAVVYTSLIIVVGAYMPIMLSSFGVSHTVVWLIASAFTLIINWFALVSIFRLGQRTGLHSSNRWFARIGYTLEVFVELPLFLNVFAISTSNASAFYLTSLFAMLCQTAVAFVLLVSTLLKSEDEAGG